MKKIYLFLFLLLTHINCENITLRIFSGNKQNVTISRILEKPLVVLVLKNNTPLKNRNVTFTIVGNACLVPDKTISIVSNPQGLAGVNLMAGIKANEVYKITASIGKSRVVFSATSTSPVLKTSPTKKQITSKNYVKIMKQFQK